MLQRFSHFAILLAVLASTTFSQPPAKPQPEAAQIVPPLALTGKTVMARVYWPSASRADQNAVQYDAEKFIKKWNRYQVVQDIKQADLVVLVVVEPMTVEPTFWGRLAWGMAASQAGSHCSGQVTGQTYTENCTNTPMPPPLLPSTILTGSILMYDAAELRAKQSVDVDPIMVSFAEKHGSRPLIGAGKKLKKAIDEAAKAIVLPH